MRYVVLVKPPDDHPGAVRIFGPWRSQELASNFCYRVRVTVDAHEEALSDEERMANESSGYAYVLRLEEPRLGDAYRWAMEGER